MVEEIELKVKQIRAKLTKHFLAIACASFTVINFITSGDSAIAIIASIFISFIPMIKMTDLEYDKIKDIVNVYRQTDDNFTVPSSISFKNIFSFSLLLMAFTLLHLLAFSSDIASSLFGLAIYTSLVLYLINSEYNPSKLDLVKKRKRQLSDDVPTWSDEIPMASIDRDFWYDTPAMEGNPVYVKSANE